MSSSHLHAFPHHAQPAEDDDADLDDLMMMGSTPILGSTPTGTTGFLHSPPMHPSSGATAGFGFGGRMHRSWREGFPEDAGAVKQEALAAGAALGGGGGAEKGPVRALGGSTGEATSESSGVSDLLRLVEEEGGPELGGRMEAEDEEDDLMGMSPDLPSMEGAGGFSSPGFSDFYKKQRW